jgi:hypothetical protein
MAKEAIVRIVRERKFILNRGIGCLGLCGIETVGRLRFLGFPSYAFVSFVLLVGYSERLL